jgi:ribonuclease E
MRDLAGLIVIDFIDMEEPRNNRQVEKRLKDALRFDRARIQVGRISSFGLLEMSRQRRRSGIIDGTTHACPTCNGAGAVRSHETATLRILRAMEAEALTGKAGQLTVKASLDVTLYILNHKRDWLRRIEEQYGVTVEIVADSQKAGDHYEIEKSGQPRELDSTIVVRADLAEEIEADAPASDDADETEATATDDSDDRPKRRRRRKRRRASGDEDNAEASSVDDREDAGDDNATEEGSGEASGDASGETREGSSDDDQGGRKRRRRGRRGGRKNVRRDRNEDENTEQGVAAETSANEQTGSTPRDAEPSLNGNGADHGDGGEKTVVSSSAPEATDTASNNERSTEERLAETKSSDKPTSSEKQSPAPPPDTPADPKAKPKKGWWNRLGA